MTHAPKESNDLLWALLNSGRNWDEGDDDGGTTVPAKPRPHPDAPLAALAVPVGG